MNDFTNEPLRSLTYILGVEFEENGEQIATRAFEKYLDGTKPFEDQLPQLEKVQIVNTCSRVHMKFPELSLFRCSRISRCSSVLMI